MRPALLRLLKRPSAVSILDSLTATPNPIGIEQLESRYTRIRRQSRCARELPVNDDVDSSTDYESGRSQQARSERGPFSFPIYEIEPSGEDQASGSPPPLNPDGNDPAICAVKALHLRPERLAFESDIGHTNDVGTRLVDRPEHKNNFDLWEELLRFRQRQLADEGTLGIWKGLTVRLDGVWLPVEGERADFFWQSFVDLGLKRVLFVKDVVDYAVDLGKSQGRCWPRLYESVVGGLLDRGMTKQAFHCHGKLQTAGLIRRDDLVRVLLPAIESASRPAYSDTLASTTTRWHSANSKLRVFRRLCRATPGHQIYGQAISTLLQQGFGEGAMALHMFLIKHGDRPKTLMEMQPLMDYVKKYGLRKEFERLQSYARRRFRKVFKAVDYEAPTKSGASGADQTDTKAGASEGKPFKDDLGARLFATRALNFDVVLGTLKMLGVSAIGPRTLREMALRSHGSQDILEKIKVLQQSGISIGDSVFSRLVRKLAGQNRDILLSDLLQSDQHPDVLEDVHVQESLLVSYYMARDSRQYNMSLAILAELLPDSPGLLDIHFRKHVAAGELRAASKVLDELTLRGETLEEDSLDFVAEQILTPRRMHHRPPLGKQLSAEAEVMLVFRFLKRVVPAGGYVSAAFWMEMLKRLGMGNYWKELRECSTWLVRQYSPKHHPQAGKPSAVLQPRRGTATGQDARMVNLIFTPEMQGAIVAWGFIYRVTSETESKVAYVHPTTGAKLIPWTRGLFLLRELEQAGLGLQRHAIRRAIRIRLAILFGRYCHSARRMNRMLRRRNPYSLRRVLKDITLAWGESGLFKGMDISEPGRLVNPRRTPYSRRRSAGVKLSRRRAR